MGGSYKAIKEMPHWWKKGDIFKILFSSERLILVPLGVRYSVNYKFLSKQYLQDVYGLDVDEGFVGVALPRYFWEGKSMCLKVYFMSVAWC